MGESGYGVRFLSPNEARAQVPGMPSSDWRLGEVLKPLLGVGPPDLNGRAESTHRQDDLTFGAAGLQIRQRLLRLGERKDAVDDDFELLGFGE